MKCWGWWGQCKCKQLITDNNLKRISSWGPIKHIILKTINEKGKCQMPWWWIGSCTLPFMRIEHLTSKIQFNFKSSFVLYTNSQLHQRMHKKSINCDISYNMETPFLENDPCLWEWKSLLMSHYPTSSLIANAFVDLTDLQLDLVHIILSRIECPCGIMRIVNCFCAVVCLLKTSTCVPSCIF